MKHRSSAEASGPDLGLKGLWRVTFFIAPGANVES